MGAGPIDHAAVSTELDLLGERWLDLLAQARRAGLRTGWRRLRRLFEWTAAGIDDDVEADPRFHLGRLAALIELTASVADRTPSTEALSVFENPRLVHLLDALAAAPGAANRDLVDVTGSNEPQVCKDLARLVSLRLVDSRKLGRRRSSSLTGLGREALADWRRGAIEAKPPASIVEPTAQPEPRASVEPKLLVEPEPSRLERLQSRHHPPTTPSRPGFWNPAAMGTAPSIP